MAMAPGWRELAVIFTPSSWWSPCNIKQVIFHILETTDVANQRVFFTHKHKKRKVTKTKRGKKNVLWLWLIRVTRLVARRDTKFLQQFLLSLWRNCCWRPWKKGSSTTQGEEEFLSEDWTPFVLWITKTIVHIS